MTNIILRCDDFDPRIDIATLKPLHEEFVKRQIPMTICINNAMGFRVGFDQAVLDYVNKQTPEGSWDIQLHTYNHDRLWAAPYPEIFMNIYTNLHLTREDFPRSKPKILYLPWNETSSNIEEVCLKLGLKVNFSRLTMRELLWNGREDQDVFFWHWWDREEQKALPKVLDRLVELNAQRIKNELHP